MLRRPGFAAPLFVLLVRSAISAAEPAAAPQAGDVPAHGLVRIASGVAGHIHPAVAITPRGTLIVVYSQADFRDMRITRSTDGGRTWEPSRPFPHLVDKTQYPGSLATLADGRVVHAWNRWTEPTGRSEPRYVEYSISSDEGLTWSPPVELPKNPTVTSVIRHPIVELASDRWLFQLSDGTLEHNPLTGKTKTFDDGRTEPLAPRPTPVPFVRTAKGTLVHGRGARSTDGGKTWQPIPGFPNVHEQGWRHEMTPLKNGWIIVSEIVGPGVGGDWIRYVVSEDDGLTWKPSLKYYDPGRPIGGRACPRTVELDDKTLGVVFYDVDAKQIGGPGLFFLRLPTAKLAAP
jgi:hypothetical protein